MDGYKKSGSREAICLIKRHVFDSLFVSRQQTELVEVWLLNNCKLTKALSKGDDLSFGVPKEQHIWPDGERRRSLEISQLGKQIRYEQYQGVRVVILRLFSEFESLFLIWIANNFLHAIVPTHFRYDRKVLEVEVLVKTPSLGWWHF